MRSPPRPDRAARPPGTLSPRPAASMILVGNENDGDARSLWTLLLALGLGEERHPDRPLSGVPVDFAQLVVADPDGPDGFAVVQEMLPEKPLVEEEGINIKRRTPRGRVAGSSVPTCPRPP